MSINQLYELTGIDRRTIKKRLIGVQVHEETKTSLIYDCSIALQAIYEKTKTEAPEFDIKKEQARFEAARADKTELEVEKIKGKLVEVDQVAAAVEKEYAYVRARLLSIPPKLAKALALIDDPQKVKETLDESIAEVLSELSKTNIYESESSVEASTDTATYPDAANEAEPSGVGGHIPLPIS